MTDRKGQPDAGRPGKPGETPDHDRPGDRPGGAHPDHELPPREGVDRPDQGLPDAGEGAQPKR